ncbi:unnamed protein product [Adineta steineri]|uniref:Uncharacterized protein n=1 Tax=Adineta steineri TaxID=433720 RepID=A0A814XSM3_9BILA|nr:unnamed protein product [Adineta steineri]CAF3927618.1 unnamed protein product [Adineta steineri]
MKIPRRFRVAKSENDKEYLIENNIKPNHSKIRRIVWKFAKGTWKAFKIGFKTSVASQPFSVALEPTAIATTVLEYQTYKRQRHH